MKKTTGCLLLVVVLLSQWLLFYGIDQMVFVNRALYKTSSKDGKHHVAVYKDQDEYTIRLESKGTILREEYLHEDFDYVKEDEVTWITDTFVIFRYVDKDFNTVNKLFDFTSSSGIGDEASFKKALYQRQKEQDKKKQEILNQKERIDTETGISLYKNSSVAVTYDYGEHWKDTGIPLNFMTFAGSDQLRLSEESYRISKAYSYIYYCHSNGYLMYAYSSDAGTTWNINDTRVEAINTLWFQGITTEHKQPGFFIADKTYGSMDCLGFYESSDGGKSFVEHHFALANDMNYLADVSYLRDSLMFVSFYDDITLYVTRDMGATFQTIDIKGTKELRYIETPYMEDGVLKLKAIAKDQTSLIFMSDDDGNHWIQQ